MSRSRGSRLISSRREEQPEAAARAGPRRPRWRPGSTRLRGPVVRVGVTLVSVCAETERVRARAAAVEGDVPGGRVAGPPSPTTTFSPEREQRVDQVLIYWPRMKRFPALTNEQQQRTATAVRQRRRSVARWRAAYRHGGGDARGRTPAGRPVRSSACATCWSPPDLYRRRRARAAARSPSSSARPSAAPDVRLAERARSAGSSITAIRIREHAEVLETLTLAAGSPSRTTRRARRAGRRASRRDAADAADRPRR